MVNFVANPFVIFLSRVIWDRLRRLSECSITGTDPFGAGLSGCAYCGLFDIVFTGLLWRVERRKMNQLPLVFSNGAARSNTPQMRGFFCPGMGVTNRIWRACASCCQVERHSAMGVLSPGKVQSIATG